MNPKNAATIGSLCSGYGGLDLAAETVFGAETVWHCEIEDAPSKILAAHWNVPNHRDLKTVDWAAVQPVDIITAGYPCQPFSHAGRRGGTDDPRHLWPFVAEAVRRVRPRYVVLENVAGHRTLGFDAVLGELAEDGYDAQWTCIRASDVGAPHGRERIFVLAAHAERSGWDGRAPEPIWRQEGRTPAARGRVDVAADPNGSRCEGERSVAAREELDDADGDWGAAPHAKGDRRHQGWPESARLIRGSDAPERSGSADVNWGPYLAAIRRWERLTRLAPCPTEVGQRGARRLSPAFDEWMMGLPGGWVTDVPISRNEQLKALGNGVVPQQAAEALRRLLPIAQEAAA